MSSNESIRKPQLCNAPVGIFDSGVGGLSVWKEVARRLPGESIIYYGDSANCPYGSRSPESIVKLSENITDFLVSEGCKQIIIACNTATAAAVETLRSRYSIPFVGMEPAVKPAAMNTKTGNIGILATEGTFSGRLYRETREKYAKDINVHMQVGYGLVEIVEQGREESEDTRKLLESFLHPMMENRVDQIVLGCTHYPFLKDRISEITGDSVSLHNPADAVAAQAERQLRQRGLLANPDNEPNYTLYTSGEPEKAKNLLSRLTTKPVTISPSP